MESPTQISVRVHKYDGLECRRWNAYVARHDGPLVVLDAQFDVDVHHEFIGEILRGTRTIEYYWLDRWYCIFRFLESASQTRLYYCNINTPPTLEDGVLSYIDLDIDVLVAPDFSYRVLDMDEFESNSERFGYSDSTKEQARTALDELISIIEARQFPFS